MYGKLVIFYKIDKDMTCQISLIYHYVNNEIQYLSVIVSKHKDQNCPVKYAKLKSLHANSEVVQS